jgi:prepilin-type N-terminal cleavage/methylation domain-containing protein/prepilin-type processing-associated H-X9-DG protein
MNRAFTLVELLAVICVIALLAAVSLPSLSGARHRAKQTACVNNSRQITLAHILYAADDASGSFSAKESTDDLDVSWLQGILKSRQVWICPATRNIVSTNVGISPFTSRVGLADLINVSTSRVSAGKSYQSVGFMCVGTPYKMNIPTEHNGIVEIAGIRKSDRNINSHIKYHNSFGLAGQVPGPSRIWICTESLFVGNPYYPDRGDNHDERGVATGFCDGHVEFLSQAAYLRSYEFSQDDGRSGIPLTW